MPGILAVAPRGGSAVAGPKSAPPSVVLRDGGGFRSHRQVSCKCLEPKVSTLYVCQTFTDCLLYLCTVVSEYLCPVAQSILVPCIFCAACSLTCVSLSCV